MPKNRINKKETTANTTLNAGRKRLEYLVGVCHYGYLLIAASDKGVCAILLGDRAADLFRELQQQFTETELIHGGDELANLLTDVINFVASPDQAFAAPLDISGTQFQQQVWAAITDIPFGQTCSYTELSMRIGCPGTVRAVARACAANKLAIVIPCHRIIGLHGDPIGYRWGIRRKQHMLEHERMVRWSIKSSEIT